MKTSIKIIISSCFLLNTVVYAEIVTDGTVGKTGYAGVQTPLSGTMIVPQDMGTTVGNNLFHSFQSFNINSGESATFTGINTLQNVISRVTGGQISTINGLLKSEVGNANFYFINPAGVTFGANAVVDVPAAFHVSTADRINFVGGGFYSATDIANSSTFSATPESFGFLGTNTTGTIAFDGSQITLKPQQTLDLVANNLTVQNNARLIAPAGEIRMVATQGTGEVSLQRTVDGNLPLPVQTPSSSNAGNIALDSSQSSDFVYVDATGTEVGRIGMWADGITLKHSYVFADNDGVLNAGATKGIDIQSNSLSLNDSRITADVLAAGNGGSVTINTNILDVFNGGYISADVSDQGNAGNVNVIANQLTIDSQAGGSTGIFSKNNLFSSGNSGDVNITAGSLDILNGGAISTSAVMTSQGNAGNININANQLTIDRKTSVDDSTGIFSNAGTWSEGNAGDVTINVASLNIVNGGMISSDTYSSGKAGSVNVNANQLKIDGQGSVYATGITSQSGVKTNPGTLIFAANGNAGNVTVSAGSLSILNGGKIESDAFSKGNAGSVNVSAKQLKIDGQGNSGSTGITSQAALDSTGNAGTVTVSAGSLDMVNRPTSSGNFWGSTGSATINSSTFGTGKGGDVTVNADNLSIGSYANISASAGSSSTGRTGNVTINNTGSGEIKLFGGGKISIVNDGNATNPATVVPGTLLVNASNLFLYGGSSITADTWGNVKAGDITVNATQSLSEEFYSSISSSSFDEGSAGNITINTPLLSLNSYSEVSAYAHFFSSGQAGNININADNINLRDSKVSVENGASYLTATTTPSVTTPGNITINTANLKMDESYIIANTTNHLKAGDVIINATQSLNVTYHSSISSSTFGRGDAGNILVMAPVIFMDDASITAKTMGVGNAGIVTVNADDTLTETNGASINSSTFGKGKAGDVIVNSRNLFLDAYAEISALAEAGSSGQAGNLTVNAADSISLVNGGQISVQTDGNATDPAIVSPSALSVNTSRLIMDNGFISATTSNNVRAGDVRVSAAESLTETNLSSIASSTSGLGNAGNILVSAPVITMDNATITAKTAAAGNAGSVVVYADNTLTETNKASINSSSYGTGNAGSVTVYAGNMLTETGSASINSSSFAAGKAGDVTVNTANLFLDSHADISALSEESGYVGAVNVTSSKISLSNGGKISIQNNGFATDPNSIVPGTLTVDSSTLTMSGGIITAATSGNVKAGDASVKTAKSLVMNSGAFIGSDTSGSANAGNVFVTASAIAMDNATITANTIGTGNAGSVVVNAGNILTENHSSISSSTADGGRAGTVNVSAPVISLDNSNISAQASGGSIGQTGNVNVTASQAINLNNNAKISLQNDATVANPAAITPTKITVTSPNITLTNSEITTAATGNIKSSDIVVNFSDKLMMDPSFVKTTANTGNGGDIYINGGNLIYLKDSGFLTSVSGANSNGGNIFVNADFLIMDTGVIQANAIGGVGGDVNLKLNGLIASYDNLILGGSWVNWQPFVPGFNVIQAASERGLSGNVNITSPQFNISGITKGLDSGSLVLPNINRNPCQNSAGNSLKRSGKGGLPINEEKDDFIPSAAVSLNSTTVSGTKSQLETSQAGSGQPCAATTF